jgi:hypothetical protein
VLFVFYSNVSKQKYFYYFLLATLFLNAIELLCFFRLGYDFLLLKFYYCSAIFVALYLLVVCTEISGVFRILQNIISPLIAYLLSAGILFSDLLISGYQLLPNGSITRITGNYYIVFQLYILISLFLAISALIIGIAKGGVLTKKRCTVAILSFAPFITIAVLIVILMQLGYKLNMAGFLSLANCVMLFAFISLTDKHKLFVMMKFVPFSKERKFHLELRSILIRFSLPASGKSVDMKQLLKEVEELVVKHTSQYFDTQKEVARILNISESSLSRKLPKREKS